MAFFSAKIFKIGINPCVIPPDAVLEKIFRQAGKSKGPIPVKGKLNGAPYKQTLVKFSGAWRLYINGIMLRDSKLELGDKARVHIAFDAAPRTIPMHAKLEKALAKNKKAKTAFEKLSPYRQKEIVRYINNLKSATSVAKNIEKAVAHLSGNGRFVGRE